MSPQGDDDEEVLEADFEESELGDEDAMRSSLVLPRSRSDESRGTALSRHDPLQAYMRDVNRYRLLTPAEEYELAVRYVEEGDLDAARTLVTSNLRLVVKIAYDYRRAYKNILDL